MKSSVAFGFEPGTLCIYRSGHGDKDGAGHIAFNEDKIQWEAHEDDAGHTVWVPIARSELLAIRDFLNKEFPPEPRQEPCGHCGETNWLHFPAAAHPETWKCVECGAFTDEDPLPQHQEVKI
jgi:hypothetical protein